MLARGLPFTALLVACGSSPPTESRAPRARESEPATAPAPEPGPPRSPVAHEQPRPGPEQPPPGSPAPVAPDDYTQRLPGAIWPPPGYVEPRCELELSTVSERRAQGYTVTARVKNLTSKAITFELPDRCPRGPVAFVGGLGPSYDYYGTCTMGACAGPRPPIRFTAPAGATIDLAQVEIASGRAACSEPLPSGRHTVGFSLPVQIPTCNRSFATIDGPPAPPEKKPDLPKTRPDPGVVCPPMPTCGIACPGGFQARDARGCLLCSCVDLRGTTPAGSGIAPR
jgi:hypothetical protein